MAIELRKNQSKKILVKGYKLYEIKNLGDNIVYIGEREGNE